MSRKIQPTQVVTYRRKIVYHKPENKSKNFFDTFLGIFLINILAIVFATATAGITASIVGALGFSQLAQIATTTTIRSLIDFSINTTFDALTNRLTTKSLLYNLLFSVSISDAGKLGRAMKEDKLIKLLSESNLLKEIGFNEKIKNFYQLKEWAKLKNVALKGKSQKTFKKFITDDELLESIFQVANENMKKEIKKFSYEQMKSLIEIEKVIYKINPKFFLKPKGLKLSEIKEVLTAKLRIGLDDFLKLSDSDVVNALIKLQTSNLTEKTLSGLNLMRMQSKFQQNLLDYFKGIYKNLKNKTQKINPIYWADKFIEKMNTANNVVIDEIRKETIIYLKKMPSIIRRTFKKYKLIPCNPNSNLLGYRFNPTTIDGSGYLIIYQKSQQQKNTSQINFKKPIRIWSNLYEIQQFAAAKNQDKFYLENWAWKSEKVSTEIKNKKILNSKINKIVNEINSFEQSFKINTLMLKNKNLFHLKNNHVRKNENYQLESEGN